MNKILVIIIFVFVSCFVNAQQITQDKKVPEVLLKRELKQIKDPEKQIVCSEFKLPNHPTRFRITSRTPTSLLQKERLIECIESLKNIDYSPHTLLRELAKETRNNVGKVNCSAYQPLEKPKLYVVIFEEMDALRNDDIPKCLTGVQAKEKEEREGRDRTPKKQAPKDLYGT